MSPKKQCIVCAKTDDQIPVVEFTFKGEKYYICSQHIPILIHSPHKLASILPDIPEEGAE
jgi:hypothetical protein